MIARRPEDSQPQRWPDEEGKQEDAAAQSVPNDGSFGRLVLLQSKLGIPAHPRFCIHAKAVYLGGCQITEGGSARPSQQPLEIKGVSS